ncbi:hypothetical protein BpHYR1_018375 [Brachionus plicatilis]|uniref:Uncharacterized protein n=1 Tax=Brachionus plicatilis TaxID=10195 RepID=A0A3M7PN73_BRAPC|nr:hypothetical protein BpHYR1_018375 [Brachionus plicatilis]
MSKEITELETFLRNDLHLDISTTDGSQTFKCNECQLEISAENKAKREEVVDVKEKGKLRMSKNTKRRRKN